MNRVWKGSIACCWWSIYYARNAPNDEKELFMWQHFEIRLFLMFTKSSSKGKMSKSKDIYFMVSNALKNHTCQQNWSNIDVFPSHKIQRSILFLSLYNVALTPMDVSKCQKIYSCFILLSNVRRKVHWSSNDEEEEEEKLNFNDRFGCNFCTMAITKCSYFPFACRNCLADDDCYCSVAHK